MPNLYSKLLGFFEGPKSDIEQPPIYIDLAPTDQADERRIYYRAFKEAMKNPKVFNIALTGPYGSGKSSIIQSILKNYRNEGNSDTLEISLAAFVTADEVGLDTQPEAGKAKGNGTKPDPNSREVTKQEIERSILQQMLYGADANKLPRSRFKRIQSPSLQSGFNSALLLFGFLASWYLLENRSSILNGAFLFPWAWSKLLNVGALFVGGWFLWHILHHFYVASLGISLKSISLKDIELATAAADQESILNRHLDEIIYFFRSTKYDLVIFEDLDRFENHQIFVTLREINSLINKNFNGKRRVRFLYALRDDMFATTDRTKFFEFIIPVIPIINSSNAIEKVTEQGKRLSLDKRLSKQFVREVSRYLNDLRLIRNIFNEYTVYQANLEPDGEFILDANKLFAVLIYKNVFPNDFEQLHRGKGQLAQIFEDSDAYIAEAEGVYKAEIAQIEQQISNDEKQLPSSLLELRKIYAMTLVEKIHWPYNQIGLQSGETTTVAQLANSELLDRMISATTLYVSNQNQGYGTQQINVGDIQAEVDPKVTFQQRKDAIERKSLAFKDGAQRRINELRTKISGIRLAKFHELIRQSTKTNSSLFEAFGDQADLARYLILEGYIDNNYYLYTSLFHAVRLSPNDNKFLKQIRGFTNPAPDCQIDNPKQVIEEMRQEDFSQAYILNVKLVDTLLEDLTANKSHIGRFVDFISSHFVDCEAFFKSYYATGKNSEQMIKLLAKGWDGFVQAAMSSLPNLSHLARIVAYMSNDDLASLKTSYPKLPQFVSENLSAILAEGVEIEPSQFKVLNVQAVDLSAIAAHSAMARYMYENGLYQVSVSNLDFIFREYLGQQDLSALHLQHYTSIRNVADPVLTNKIEADFKTYFQEVLLKLETNSSESVEAIVAVLGNNELVADDLRSFLSRQAKSLAKLVEIPERLYVAVFELEKIEPTWENCLAFFSSDAFDEVVFTEYLGNSTTLEALSKARIDTSGTMGKLRLFLLGQAKLSDEAYRTYVRCQPTGFTVFPTGLAPEKLAILIEEGSIKFSAESFAALSSHPELQVRFVATNITTYLQTADQIALDDDFREKLLNSEIEDKDRIKIIKVMDLGQLATLPARAASIGRVLVRTGADIGSLDEAPIMALVRHAVPVSAQIKLFNRLQNQLPDSLVPQLISVLPKQFCDITRGTHIPQLPDTAENRTFADLLKARGIISSWSGGSVFNSNLRIYLFRK